MLTASAVLVLALSCARRVSPDVLPSVAHLEGHWSPLAIHDNVTQEAFEPRSSDDAEQIASRLICCGQNSDLGLLHAPCHPATTRIRARIV
jgi:hypothetical protein